jgi:hypothetical protein
MECTNLVDPHQLLFPWFTVVFVLFCIYTPDNQFPRPIVKQGGGLFWILSDSNVSLEEQIWLTECIYLADYFKLRKKKEKTEWNVLFENNRWTNINPLPQWNHIWQTPGKTGLAIKSNVGVRENPKKTSALFDNRSWELIVGGIYAK